MDTEKARVFITVMNEGSLSEAANRLGYTVSGISRSIASIEDEIGIKLFFRGKKGVSLTRDAESFVPFMRELVRQEEKIAEMSAGLKGLEDGTVTIGISHGGYFRLISEALKKYTDRYPGVKIRTLMATSTELLKALEEHEADLAIMTYRESDLNFHELKKAPMVACVPSRHPMAGNGIFPLEQFEKEAYIAPYPNMDTDYGRALEMSGVSPNIQYTTTDIYAAYCMVEAGLGVSLLSSTEVESWQGNVSVLKTDPELCFRIGIMYPDESDMTAAAGRFLKEITEC